MSTSADRTLLFGGLAVLNDFLTQDQLQELIRDWTADKAKSLGAIALARGYLPQEVCRVIDDFVDIKLAKQAGGAAKTLAAFAAAKALTGTLREIDDAEIQQSVASFEADITRVESSAYFAQMPTTVAQGPLRFEVKRFHARGGLGEVFLAHDNELNRDVALKEIKFERAHDRISQTRFVLEAEITGNLEHPGVVPVYGLGRYADGRPYYAMKFIKGRSLQDQIIEFHQSTQSISERNLSFRELLGRFLDICNTMQYAHDQGILHRDLKPGNIMLGQYGETLVVDWGLAKRHTEQKGEGVIRASQDLRFDWDDVTKMESAAEINAVGDNGSSPTLPNNLAVTKPGRGFGTPGYASPEQARGDVDRLGPATDIYALGAILYSLLTGESPNSDRVRRTNQSAPVKGVAPSSDDEGWPEILRPREILAEIPAALEAICVKAMAHDVVDRYCTCGELADDVRHWLADEPITALPDRPLVRAQRWARKHPGPVSAIAATLLVGLIGLTAGIYTVNAQRQQTEIARKEEKVQRIAAEESRKEAQTKEAETFAIFSFINNRILKSVRPKGQAGGLGKDISMREALDAAIPFIEQTFVGQPVMEARLRDTIATSFMQLGEYQKARGQFDTALHLRQKSLAADDLAIAASKNNLANSLVGLAQFQDVLKLRKEALECYQSKRGPDAPETLLSMSNLATAYSDLGRNQEALELNLETLKRRTAQLGPDHADTLMSMHNLFSCYNDLGRNKEAAELGEKTLRERKRKLGPTHPDTLMTMNCLANVYGAIGKKREALDLLQEAIKIKTELLGADHPETLRSRVSLANRLSALGRHKDSFDFNVETLALQKTSLGPSHPDTLMTMNNLAIGHLIFHRNAEALQLADEAMSLLEAGATKGITSPPDTVRRLHWTRACALEELHRYPEADQSWSLALSLSQPHEKPSLTADRDDYKSKRGKK